MTTDYVSRLHIPITGSIVQKFFCNSGELLAIGYDRVVLGARGPYVEFDLSQLQCDAFHATMTKHYYYEELRSNIDNIKCYVQLRRVDYADYLPGKCYISPFELYDETSHVLISPLNTS